MSIKMTSSTVGKVSSVTSKYKWEIKNFCTGCKNVGDLLKSPEFSTLDTDDSTTWQLWLYPKGETDSTKDFISVHLNNLTSSNITTNVSLAILNDRDEVAYEKVLGEKTFNKTLNWGYPYFVSRNYVTNKANGILRDDKLTIVCTISSEPIESKKIDDKKAETDQLEESKKKRRLLEFDEFERMITEDDDQFSDVSLKSGKRIWKAHKCVLAKKSPIFAAMFKKEESKNSIVDVGNVEANVFMEFLRFVYSGKVEDIEKNAEELMTLADKYKVDRLFDMCEDTLSKNLNVDNVVERLKLANRYRALNLKKKAVDFVVSNAKDIFLMPEFKGLTDVSPDVLCEVLHSMAMRDSSDKK